MECTQDEGIELRNSDGAIKKPNAAQTLGKIVEVSSADPVKYDEDSVLVCVFNII